MIKNHQKIESMTASINKFQREKLINYDCLYLTHNSTNYRVIFDGYAFFHNETNAFKKVVFTDLNSNTYSEEIVDGELKITGYDCQKIILAILSFLNNKKYKLVEDLAA